MLFYNFIHFMKQSTAKGTLILPFDHLYYRRDIAIQKEESIEPFSDYS